ncbi:MAG: hypothetical protein LUD22_01670 [Coprobacillus sp.]|nr:hypothetical protein [Coprobacillus sp.]
MERLGKFFNRRLVKYLTLGIVFIIASVCSFLEALASSQVIAHYGSNILEFFPTMAVLYMPIFCFIMIWAYYYTTREKGKQNSMLTFGVITVVAMGISFILQLVEMGLYFGWNLNSASITPLFPWDILVCSAIFLAIGIIVLWRYVKRKNNYVVQTLNYVVPLRKRTIVMVVFFSLFAAEFLGTAIFSLTLLDGYMDPNIWGVIPIVLSYLLMAAEGVIYYIYKERHDSQKVFRNGLIALSASAFVLLFWALIATCINPQLISESLDGLMPVGYTIKTPIGLFINLVGVVVPLIVALVYYIARYWNIGSSKTDDGESVEESNPEQTNQEE